VRYDRRERLWVFAHAVNKKGEEREKEEDWLELVPFLVMSHNSTFLTLLSPPLSLSLLSLLSLLSPSLFCIS
jgi:hypothetical protein